STATTLIPAGARARAARSAGDRRLHADRHHDPDRSFDAFTLTGAPIRSWLWRSGRRRRPVAALVMLPLQPLESAVKKVLRGRLDEAGWPRGRAKGSTRGDVKVPRTSAGAG